MRLHVALVAIGLIAISHVVFFSAPDNFPVGAVVHIPSGATVGEAAGILEREGVIRYPLLFKLFARSVQAGSYALPDEASVVSMALRLSSGDTGLQPVAVLIPEGATIREINELLGVSIPRSEEGYLFPDTYYFLPGTPTEIVVARMRERYEEVVGPLRGQIEASGHSEHEIITMASLLEREARRHETMQTVAGILWNRIELGMPLQVDAVFGYIFDRPTYSPKGEDLEVDSPYNTYLYRGLPPGPIANPGLDAIRAALQPTETEYLYYLTGADGLMYYAKTFDEHVRNRRFLR